MENLTTSIPLCLVYIKIPADIIMTTLEEQPFCAGVIGNIFLSKKEKKT